MNVQALLSHEFPPIEHVYTARETSLYALTAGYGQDPMDERQLRYVYGDCPRTTGGMALVMANPGFWQQQAWTEIDWVRCVLGEQRLLLHKPLPSSGRLIGQLRVTGVEDRGKSFGALLHSERTLRDAGTGVLYATLSMTSICRGDGGFGGKSVASTRLLAPPNRPSAAQCEMPTLYQQALLFDLHGIVNPIHSVPDAAREAGYPRPILHGICTVGLVHHALTRELAAYDADKVVGITARFRNPVYPGETLVTTMWIMDDTEVIYETHVKERGVLALQGSATLALKVGKEYF